MALNLGKKLGTVEPGRYKRILAELSKLPKTIESVLKEMGADKIPTIHVLNKVDLIPDENIIINLQRGFPDSVTISAQQHLRLSSLKSEILKVKK